jgi:exopolysaccharide biosynthesis polyprenyl glycosylphosphotransferase
MGKRSQVLVTFASDILTMCFAWSVYYGFRVQSKWIDVAIEPDFLVPMFLVCAYWALLFFVAGLYKPWYAASRFDELTLVFKTLSLGCLFLFFAVFVDDRGANNIVYSSRFLIMIYWGFMVVSVSIGRLGLRSILKRLLVAGIGARSTIIVGSRDRAKKLNREVLLYPALGYRIIGIVLVGNVHSSKPIDGVPVLGQLEHLHDIIANRDVKEVLIALNSADHGQLLEIIANCNSLAVGLKIVPDLYDIISGQARTNAIYGFPLIEISPQLMSQWEEAVKRSLDVAVSFLVLILGFPVWGLICLIIKLESPGPILYRQERVGKDGERFSIIKFRSMSEDAEKGGPQWAHKKDPRVTRVGKWLRKLHLDEVPQFINVLNGHMSLVGPRPERPMFVESLSKEIPLYTRRLKVRPGITGWAQVKHQYDESIEDVRKKVQYDLYYIENMSLRMDMKILFSTASHMLLGKGR